MHEYKSRGRLYCWLVALLLHVSSAGARQDIVFSQQGLSTRVRQVMAHFAESMVSEVNIAYCQELIAGARATIAAE